MKPDGPSSLHVESITVQFMEKMQRKEGGTWHFPVDTGREPPGSWHSEIERSRWIPEMQRNLSWLRHFLGAERSYASNPTPVPHRPDRVALPLAPL